MIDSDPKSRLFKPRTSIVSSILILFGLLSVLVILQLTIKWPAQQSETVVFIGVFIISLLPVIFALLNVLFERGGSIEYKGLKLSFAQTAQMGITGLSVPVNIGVRGQAVTDHYTKEILEALQQATACDIVIIDLEEGQAWWETRLLVLLSGAVRLRKPEKVVFIATDSRIKNCFQGWGYPSELLPLLLPAHPQYALSYYATQAAARQWELVEPTSEKTILPGPPFLQQAIEKYKLPNDDLVVKLLNHGILKGVSNNPNFVRFDESIADENQLKERLDQIADLKKDPVVAIWQRLSQPGIAMQHSWWAFDQNTGLPSRFFAEQLLASELGDKIENRETPKGISLVRLENLFRPVLHKDKIDETWPTERQLKAFFESEAHYLAVTQNGQYKSILSRLTVLSAMVKTIVEKK